MKRYILKAGILMLSALPMACTGNYLNINTNPYEVDKDEMMSARMIWQLTDMTSVRLWLP